MGGEAGFLACVAEEGGLVLGDCGEGFDVGGGEELEVLVQGGELVDEFGKLLLVVGCEEEVHGVGS